MKCFICTLVFIGLFFCAPSARADDDALYTVKNVVVDITAPDAVTARGKAFAAAQGQAFTKLMTQIKPSTDVKTPDDVTLGKMVKDFEIVSEHVASNRYRGHFIFRFDPAQVKAYLPGGDIAQPVTPPIATPVPSPTPITEPARPHTSVTLMIMFETLQDWRHIQSLLQQSGAVSDVTIYAMKYKQAEVRTRLIAPLSTLEGKLRQDGYRLTPQGPNTYALQRGA